MPVRPPLSRQLTQSARLELRLRRIVYVACLSRSQLQAAALETLAGGPTIPAVVFQRQLRRPATGAGSGARNIHQNCRRLNAIFSPTFPNGSISPRPLDGASARNSRGQISVSAAVVGGERRPWLPATTCPESIPKWSKAETIDRIGRNRWPPSELAVKRARSSTTDTRHLRAGRRRAHEQSIRLACKCRSA